MALDVEGQSVSDIQKAFLSIDNKITPDFLVRTLRRLASIPTVQEWVAAAVLYTITDKQNATSRIGSSEALKQLVDIGCEAAQKGHQQPLDVAKHVLSAFQKTGIKTQSSTSSIVDNSTEDDEDSPWFDTNATTPTPSPEPAAAPSIPLSVLIRSLSNPLVLAKQMASHPDRLALWLQSLDPKLLANELQPHRFEIVSAALTQLSIQAAKDPVGQLKQSRILPSLVSGDCIWSSEDPREFAIFHLNESSRLEQKFGDARTALSLADHGIQQAESYADDQNQDSDALDQLRKLQRQLSLFCQISSNEKTSSELCQKLANDPAEVIANSCNQEGGADKAAVVSLIDFAIAIQSAHSRAVLITLACFKSFKSNSTIPSVLTEFLREGSEGLHDEISSILISLLLSSPVGRPNGLQWLLSLISTSADTSASSSALPPTLRRTFPDLRPQNGTLPSTTPDQIPSCETVYHQLTMPIVTRQQHLLLLHRCRAYLQVADTLEGIEAISPWIVILTRGEQAVQQALLRRILDAGTQRLHNMQDFEAFESSLQSLTGKDGLFDTLDGRHVTTSLLECLLERGQFDLFTVINSTSSPLGSSEVLEQITIHSARTLFDKASGGRAGVDDLKKVQNCLAVLSSSPSPRVKASNQFLASVVRLQQLSPPLPSSLHGSLPMSPLEIRLMQDKLGVIKLWLERGGQDSAWKRGDDVLSTAIGLCQGASVPESLGQHDDDDTGSTATAQTKITDRHINPPTKSWIQIKVLAMLADASISHNDLSLTNDYISRLLKSYKDLNRQACRDVNDLDLRRQVAESRETLWLTLFALSKHPNAQNCQMTSSWLAESLAYAPVERVPEILKRWKTVSAAAEGQDEKDLLQALSPMSNSGLNATFSSPSTSLLRLPSGASAAVNVASGLGAGVFGLAASAMSAGAGVGSNWVGRGISSPSAPAPRQLNEGTEHASHGHPGPATGWPSSATGVSNALSSLAGTFSEGYSSRLTGFLGGSGQPRSQSPHNPLVHFPSEQPQTTQSPQSRTAASLFDNLGGSDGRSSPSSSNMLSSSPSGPQTTYLDPAERAARAARGFFSGLRGASGEQQQQRSASPSAMAGGWASRGMEWLLDDQGRPQSGNRG